MNRQQIYSFLGVECVLYLYLAEEFKNKGYRVLVNDWTKEGAVAQDFCPMAFYNEKMERQEIRRLHFGRQLQSCDWEGYDIVLNILGFGCDEEIEKHSDVIYLITDMAKRSLLKAAGIVKRMKKDFFLIYIEDSQQNIGYRHAEFYLQPGYLCKGYYVMDVSNSDMSNLFKIQYNGVFEQNSISERCGDVLRSITTSEWKGKKNEKAKKKISNT